VHDDLSAGHFGREKTLELVRRSYWWPKLKEDAHVHVMRIHAAFSIKIR
jgi:hypothetical protein